MIREDRELLVKLARLNGEMASLALRMMDDSASAAEQQNYAQRLIAAGEQLKRRADERGHRRADCFPAIDCSSWPYRRAWLGTMSSSWETRSRLFLEELEKLVEWLSSDAPRAPAALEETTVRLLAVAVTLLRNHQVDVRGQCQFCGGTGWTWRLWRRRQRCTVHQALDLGMGQSLDVVWWRVFESVGRKWSLAEVRAWVAGRAADTGATVPAETAQGNDEDEPTIVLGIVSN